MAELLLELFSEEIPAGAQVKAVDDFKRIFAAKFAAAGVTYTTLECYTTPRRIAIVADGLPTSTAATTEERRGPRTDAPAQAIDGFLKSSGLSLGQLEKRQTAKGDFYFAVIKHEAKDIATALTQITEEVISTYTWPKSMCWGSHNIRWIRPLHSILCIFNGAVLPVTFGHIKSDNKTRGHRFLGNGEFSVDGFADYETKLKNNYVILNQAERQRIINEQADKLAKENGAELKKDDSLSEEIANLVEWPVALIGKIEEKFMSIPPEVLIVTLRSHQRYFCLLNKDGKLANYFITVSNTKPADGGVQIMTGNGRVLRARLEDAKFFWEQDKKNGLETYIPGLQKIIFHAKLGTVAEKTVRIAGIANEITKWLPACEKSQVERAAKLCKADLTTGMVGEFPELQGLMGGYYATANKEHPDVASAIKEHYSPVGAGDTCPSAPVSIAVAIADKVDSLVGLFAIDEKPTGSRDPYALRRAALGVIRIILENNLRVPLKELFHKATLLYDDKLFKNSSRENLTKELLVFFADRLRVSLKDQNIRHDIIDALFDLAEDDLTRIVNKSKALAGFLGTADGINLLAAYKRATNIVQIEEKKDKISYNASPNAALLEEAAEKNIYKLFSDLKPVISGLLKAEQFAGAMQELAKLRKPVDEFFENVKVNNDNENLRVNRLLLLAQFREFLNNVADFSKIETYS